MSSNNSELSSSIVSLLKSHIVMTDFPKELLEKLSTFAKIITVEPKTTILEQGQPNSNVYFLISGTVHVLVDGHFVAEIQDSGIIGEMSVITRKVCSATTITENHCTFIQVSSDEIQNLPEQENVQLHLALYKLFSHFLTEKLHETNQKAKYFEKANTLLEDKVQQRTKDLEQKTTELIKSHQTLENQNTELIASHNKIEELYNTRDLTLQKLDDLYNVEFHQLQNSLSQLQAKLDGADKEGVSKFERRLSEVMELLRPISERFSSEQNIKDKKILFADSDKRQQVVAKLALGGTGVQLSTVSNQKEGEILLNESSYNLLFVSSDTLKLAKSAIEKHPSIKIVFITSDPIPEYLPLLNDYPFISNIVSRDKDDKSFTIKNIMTTVTKLLSKDIFGLDKYLSWGAKIESFKVKQSDQRHPLVQDMSDYFLSLGMRKSNLGRCQIVAEELLMNAIYDAPVDKNGKSLYNHLPRTEKIILPEEYQSSFTYGTDGLLMGISVADPFGGLNMSTLLNYLSSCYSGQSGTLNTEKGGAGRGLHQIIENSDLTVFNVSSGLKTQVIALFNVDPKNSTENPSFHFFQT